MLPHILAMEYISCKLENATCSKSPASPGKASRTFPMHASDWSHCKQQLRHRLLGFCRKQQTRSRNVCSASYRSQELCNWLVSDIGPNRPNSSVTSTWRITEIQNVCMWRDRWVFVILCYQVLGALRCKPQLTPGSGHRRTQHTKFSAAADNR